jgi:colanic acid biosynthesis glycosyl transferase WcaI
MMRILYVSQYFPPEMGAPSARVFELAREWVRLGHEVTVLTAFAHHPTGVKAPRDRWKLTRVENVDGIRVVRTYVYATANRGTLKRMISYATFMLSAMTIGWFRVSRPDVVIATSPQLLCGLAGYVLARTLAAPFIFEVRDLWPESILAVSAMKDNLLVRLLKRIARFLYQHCERIVTVGEGYRRGICELYGISRDKIAVVHNGIDRDLFTPVDDGGALRRRLGWQDRFVVMYIGTHGMAHDLQRVLAAANQLRDEPDKLFVFVGEGAEKDNLKQQAHAWSLKNVTFLDQQPRERVPALYSACDLGLVTLRDSRLFQEVLPSKIFEYLGMERPVLITVDGEARRLIEQAAAGEYVPAGDLPAMVEAIQRMSMQPVRLEEMGRSGREYVLEHFNRSVLARKYLQIMRQVSGQTCGETLRDEAFEDSPSETSGATA